MSKRLQLRGGTTTEHASFTGAVREVTVDTTKDTLVVHDGSTVGGTALSTAADVAAAIGAIDLTAAIATVIDAAPESLNTLNELAAALGDDANYSATITTALGTKLPKAGGLMTGDTTHGDGVKAKFGTSDDLEIFHDGVNSIIKDSGVGNLELLGTNLRLKNSAQTKSYLNANDTGAVTIYYDGVAKLATTSAGVSVTGNLAVSGTVDGRDVAADGVTADAAMPKSGGTFSGNYTVDNFGIGAVGKYASDKYQSVFAMGSSYQPAANGTSLSGSYGLSWTHTNAGGQSKAGLNHQLLVVQAGASTCALGTGIWTSGNVTAYSDKRVKENIEVIPNALEKVLQLSGYTFDRTDADMPRQTGLIAQEVLKVLPEAVSGSEEEHYSVAYGNVVGLLIEAIKEQQTQIETLMDMVGE